MPHGKHTSPRINVHLLPPLHRRLRGFVERTGRGVTAVVSDSIAEYLERHDAPTKTEGENR